MMTDAPTMDRPDKVAVIVLGMHRSGTSSLAGMLDGLGCCGPATLMPASDTNAAGYYESLPVFRLNDAILTALGSRWDDWRSLRPDVHLSPRLAEFHDKACAVIEAEYGDKSLIYLKDPRISMLLPFWRVVLEAAGYCCVHLHTHRSPSEIAKSLQQRDGIDPGMSLLAWLSQVLQAERYSRGQVRHFTSYEALLRNPAAVAMAAETAFGFPWPRPTEDGAGRVDRALRHHDDGARAVLEDACVPGLIRQTLEILERWADQGEQAADHARLDDIAAAFDEAKGLFAGAMEALRSCAAQLAPTRTREEVLKTEKAALETCLTQATEDKVILGEHLTQITQARDEALRDRDATTEAARQQLQQRHKEIEVLRGQLEVQRQEFLSSTSWRVSAPVRALGRLIRPR